MFALCVPINGFKVFMIFSFLPAKKKKKTTVLHVSEMQCAPVEVCAFGWGCEFTEGCCG